MAGCGSSQTPTTPTPAPPPVIVSPAPATPTVAVIAGRWAGRLTALDTRANQRIAVAISAVIVQDDRRVNGTWIVTTRDNDIKGEIAGVLTGFDADTRFAGTMTWDSDVDGGVGRCRGTMEMTGTAQPIFWTAPTLALNNTCAEVLRDFEVRLDPAL